MTRAAFSTFPDLSAEDASSICSNLSRDSAEDAVRPIVGTSGEVVSFQVRPENGSKDASFIQDAIENQNHHAQQVDPQHDQRFFDGARYLIFPKLSVFRFCSVTSSLRRSRGLISDFDAKIALDFLRFKMLLSRLKQTKFLTTHIRLNILGF
jgi:hypothetical protein